MAHKHGFVYFVKWLCIGIVERRSKIFKVWDLAEMDGH